MKIVNLKVNGVTNPIGFAYKKIKVSWQVESFTDKIQENVIIEVSENSNLENVLYTKSGNLHSKGENLELELKPRTRYYYAVTVVGNKGEQGKSEIAFFETGKMDEVWEGDFIETQDDDKFHPVFTKKFNLKKPIKQARIYVTGLGLYEAYINNKKVGEDFLAPFCNDYNEHIQYQTYDIKDMLVEDNKIEVMTGNGWYKGRLGFNGGKTNIYGDKFSAIAEILVEYEDGSIEKIITDDTWEYYRSEIQNSGIYDGEIYDRTLNSEKEIPGGKVSILDIDKKKLVERYSLPVVVKEEINVKEIIKTPAGETVLDMGQNFAGYMEFKGNFEAGTKISLEFGEILQGGNFFNGNYRTANKPYVYISNGEPEKVRPRFTYFAFRYVKVTGWSGEIKPEDFIGKVVYSDLETTSFLDTSNDKLNKLASNCMWGQKSNFLDMPTDCPQRDERLGWTGDAQVFAPTASFNMDTRTFYQKFLYDLRLDQKKMNGALPNFLPNIDSMPGGSSVWGDVATFLPEVLYDYYGDKDALEENYSLMKDWVDYIIKEEEKKGKSNLYDFGFHFGDWLAQDGATPDSVLGGTDTYFIASVYYYASTVKVAKAAKILGKLEEASFYIEKAGKIKEAIFAEYFSPKGRLTIDTQTAYYICLKFEVYISKEKILAGLKSRLKRDCYKIKGGFVGAPMMCQVLAENGFADIAYYILFQNGFPGWMHCIDLGATTIWERWNSVLDDGSISPTDMNSLNHYAYGSVMEFVYRNISGINQTEPGFREVLFKPVINSRLNYVNYTYASVSGKYVSNWKVNKDGTVTMHFEVPFNCKAVAKLPEFDGDDLQLEAGSHDITYTPKVDYRKLFNMDSILDEMKDNAQAIKILEEDLPLAAKFIAGGNKEDMSASLNELQFNFFMGFNPEIVGKAAARLFEIKAF